MSADISALVGDRDALTSVNEEAQLVQLQRLVDAFFAHPRAAWHLEVWFRLFERFPEHDGFEMFWSILHALESQPNCDVHVVRSVQRKPSRFPVLMVSRMLNAGKRCVADVNLLQLLGEVATHPDVLVDVREGA